MHCHGRLRGAERGTERLLLPRHEPMRRDKEGERRQVLHECQCLPTISAAICAPGIATAALSAAALALAALALAATPLALTATALALAASALACLLGGCSAG